MLIHLMEQYVREETDRLSSDDGLNELMMKIEQRNQQNVKNQMKSVLRSLKQEEEPPSIERSSGDNWEIVDRWGDRIWGNE